MTAPETPEMLIRAASLYLPIAAALALVLRQRPDRARIAGAVLATAWNVAGLLVVNAIAMRAGWWTFGADTALVGGVPVDLWLGWAILWGAVPMLATTRLLPAVVVLVAADLVLMPLANPVVQLDLTWFVGEAVAVASCLVPGMLIGRWTATDEHLPARAVLQLVMFTTLVFYVVPTLAFAATDGGWAVLLGRPRSHFLVAGALLAPFGAMALQAVREFVDHGGTPVPLDPPKRLVTTGPYAYVANPMQLGATVLLAAWGVLLGSAAVVAAALMGAVFAAGLAAWNEGRDLSERFGDDWRRYRKDVRAWLPAWRPHVVGGSVVYASGTCEPCSQVGSFLAGRNSVGLEVRPAEECTYAMRRITYEHEASRSTGIAAVGRSLEHVNLAWAVASWVVRLPGLEYVLQLITDAVGGGPRSISQRTTDERTEKEGQPWQTS